MSNLYFDAESVKKAKCENNLTRNNKTIRHHKVQSIKNVVIADNNGKSRVNSHDNDKTSIKAGCGDKKTPVTPKCCFVRKKIDLLFSLIFSGISSIFSLIFSKIVSLFTFNEWTVFLCFSLIV